MTLPDDDEYDAHVSGTVPISSERESPITLRNVGIDTSMTRCTARYVVTHANPTAAPRELALYLRCKLARFNGETGGGQKRLEMATAPHIVRVSDRKMA